tara:strand:+ start:134 stop:442 length:309 start_codon:yes stop_codon:yes gene_type:complete
MKILSILAFLFCSFFLLSCTPQDFGHKGNCGWTGCPEGETPSSLPGVGQYTKTTKVGTDKYMIEGFSSSDAMKGAQAHCSKLGKTMELETINEDTVAIFKCI